MAGGLAGVAQRLLQRGHLGLQRAPVHRGGRRRARRLARRAGRLGVQALVGRLGGGRVRLIGVGGQWGRTISRGPSFAFLYPSHFELGASLNNYCGAEATPPPPTRSASLQAALARA